MSKSDLQAIRVALAEMPRICRYHGENLDRWGRQPWEDPYCCETGKAAYRRRDAVKALGRLDVEVEVPK